MDLFIYEPFQLPREGQHFALQAIRLSYKFDSHLCPTRYWSLAPVMPFLKTQHRNNDVPTLRDKKHYVSLKTYLSQTGIDGPPTLAPPEITGAPSWESIICQGFPNENAKVTLKLPGPYTYGFKQMLN